MKKESSSTSAHFYGLHLLLAAVVLIFSISIADQFALPKYAILQCGTLILFTSWLFWSLSFKEISIKRTSIEILILFFALVFGLSTIFSLNSSVSLLGKYHRYEGLLTQVCYFILFFLGVQLLSDYKAVWKHTKIMVLIAALVSIYGLVQYAGFDVFNWTVLTGSVAGQSLSTFGNRSFLGGFLVLALPLALAWFFSDQGSNRWIAGLASMLIAVTLVSTETRASWVGAFLGLAFFAFLNKKRIKLTRVSPIAIVLLFTALVLIISVFGSQHFDKINELVLRATEIIRFSGGSGAIRLEIWKAALKITALRPLLGTGPETFRLLFTKFQSVRYSQITPWQSIADDAHSYLLNLGSTLGLLGLLAMTTFLMALLWKGTKNALAGGNLVYSGFLCSIVSYVVHLSFSTGHLASNAWLWVIFGIISYQLFPSNENRKISTAGYRWFIIALAILIALGGTVFAATRYLADFYFSRGERSIQAGLIDNAVPDFYQAIYLAPYYSGYKHELALLYIDMSTSRNNYEDLLRAVNILRENIEGDTYNIDGYMILASAYLKGAENFGNKGDAELAIHVLNRSLEIKPKSALTHFFFARSFLVQGKRGEAKAHLRKALKIEPNYESARKLLLQIER